MSAAVVELLLVESVNSLVVHESWTDKRWRTPPTGVSRLTELITSMSEQHLVAYCSRSAFQQSYPGNQQLSTDSVLPVGSIVPRTTVSNTLKHTLSLTPCSQVMSSVQISSGLRQRSRHSSYCTSAYWPTDQPWCLHVCLCLWAGVFMILRKALVLSDRVTLASRRLMINNSG